MTKSILPHHEQENNGKFDTGISTFLKLIVSLLMTLLMSVWDGGGASFDRSLDPDRYTWKPDTTPPSKPTPAPQPETVRKPADRVRCPDCIYSGRCFRALKLWVTISGAQCKQSRRKRQNYPLIAEVE
jgi:hypothetical protein